MSVISKLQKATECLKEAESVLYETYFVLEPGVEREKVYHEYEAVSNALFNIRHDVLTNVESKLYRQRMREAAKS
jgi:hypothetical protein